MYWRFTVYFMVCMSMWVKTDSSHAFIRVCVCVPVSVHLIVFACVSFVTVSNCVRVIVSLFFTYVGFVFSLSFPACVCRTVISGSALDSILVSSHQQTNSEAWCSSRLRRRGRCTQTHFFPAHSQRTIHRKQLIGDPFCLEVSICWICDSNQNRT